MLGSKPLDAAVATFRAALNDSGGDPSLRALNLAVPGFSELGLKLEDGFDPVKLCERSSSVREGARQGLFHGIEGGLRCLIFGRSL